MCDKSAWPKAVHLTACFARLLGQLYLCGVPPCPLEDFGEDNSSLSSFITLFLLILFLLSVHLKYQSTNLLDWIVSIPK